MTDGKVGYGTPPREWRFRKGISGNPGGRPRRSESDLVGVVDRILCETVTLRIRGADRRARRWEASLRALMSRAVKGEVAAAAMLLELREARRHSQNENGVIYVRGGLPAPSDR
jgi:hypothetical protein